LVKATQCGWATSTYEYYGDEMRKVKTKWEEENENLFQFWTTIKI
jgi:hypothetical protein